MISNCDIVSGVDFQEKTLGQLAPKFSDLVASKSISVKSVKSEKVSCQWKKLSRICDPSSRNGKLYINFTFSFL